jgi:hypothetical protein
MPSIYPMSSGDLNGALVFGFGAGVFFFFKGFKAYREYRVVEDTPEIPIRSMPMGLVQIHGKAKGENLVPSPVTATPCLFYKVDVERWVQNRNGGSWCHYRTDADGPLFYLEDATGHVLVNAHNAEYDLFQSGRRQIGMGARPGSLTSLLTGKGDPTLTTTPGALVGDGALFNYIESIPGGSGLSMSLGGLSIGRIGGFGGGSAYRLTEYLILPEHWYDITGTCTENPAAKDEHDRNMIVKGQNEPTFLISWRDERRLEASLQSRAMLHIFGGAALSIACLALLLAKLGWV